MSCISSPRILDSLELLDAQHFGKSDCSYELRNLTLGTHFRKPGPGSQISVNKNTAIIAGADYSSPDHSNKEGCVISD